MSCNYEQLLVVYTEEVNRQIFRLIGTCISVCEIYVIWSKHISLEDIVTCSSLYCVVSSGLPNVYSISTNKLILGVYYTLHTIVGF